MQFASMSLGYKIYDQKATHFFTFSVVGWIDLFTRQCYKDLFLDSLRYCQANKGLIVNAWCVMTSHVHLIGRSDAGKLSPLICDLKKYTSRMLIDAIEQHPSESRKGWMTQLFRQYGSTNSRNEHMQLWQQNNAPIHLYSPAFTAQKLDYVHQNPVTEGWVTKPEDYLYSSAVSYAGKERGLLKIELL